MSVKSIKSTLERVEPTLDRLSVFLLYAIEATLFLFMCVVTALVVIAPLDQFTQVEQGLWAGIAGLSLSVAVLILTRWLRDDRRRGETE